MSENDNGAKGGGKGWSDEELLDCLIQAISQPDVKPDLDKIIYPNGRNSSGFKQKLGHLKRAHLKSHGLASGADIKNAAAAAKRAQGAGAGAGKKRKADGDTNGESPAVKKRGRVPKKTVSEPIVEDEAQGEKEEEVPIKPEAFEDDEQVV